MIGCVGLIRCNWVCGCRYVWVCCCEYIVGMCVCGCVVQCVIGALFQLLLGQLLRLGIFKRVYLFGQVFWCVIRCLAVYVIG